MGCVGLAHRDHVKCLVFTPDGRTLISGSEDKTVRIWDASTGREIRRLEGYKGRVEAVALSPDGKTLASCGQDGTVRLVELATGRDVGKPLSSRGPGYQLAFAPDGKGLCAASTELHFWDVTSGRPRADFPESNKWTYAMALAPDGKTALAGNDDGMIRQWDLSTAGLLRQWQAHTAAVRYVAFVSSGTEVVSAGEDGAVRLWRLDTGKEVRLLWRAPDKRQFPVMVCPDGKAVAVVNPKDGKLYVIDLATARTVREFPIALLTQALAFTPDGRTLAAGSWGLLWLYDVPSGRLRMPVESKGHMGRVRSAAFSPDGSVLATAAEGTDLCCWRAATGEEICRLPSRAAGEVTHVAFDGEDLVSVTDQRVIQFWDVKNRKEKRRHSWPGEGSPAAVCAESGTAVFWSDDRGVEVLEVVGLRRGQLLRRIAVAQETCVSLSPEGTLLATASPSEGIRLWDLKEGRRLDRPWPQRGPFTHLTLLPAGRGIVTTTFDLQLWYDGASEPLEPFARAPGSRGPYCITVSPDGRNLVLADDATCTIGVWELWTRRLRFEFRGHEGVVFPVAFSRDGRRLASCSADRTAVVWDLTGGTTSSAEPVSAERLRKWWEDLGQEDAARAVRAVWALAAAAEEAVPFLGRRLRPAPAVEEAQLARLIVELQSDDFSTRRRAADKLEEWGEQAESALRRALEKRPSAELSRAAGMLLEKLRSAKRNPSGDRLRMLRAIEVLEHANTGAARSLLEKLAAGAAPAVLTQEARASLERMRRIAQSSP
jgi:WD40 repeat protein